VPAQHRQQAAFENAWRSIAPWAARPPRAPHFSPPAPRRCIDESFTHGCPTWVHGGNNRASRCRRDGQPVIRYWVSERDVAHIKRATSTCSPRFFAAGAHTVHVPIAGHETLRTLRRSRGAAARVGEGVGSRSIGVPPARHRADGRRTRELVVDHNHRPRTAVGTASMAASVRPRSRQLRR